MAIDSMYLGNIPLQIIQNEVAPSSVFDNAFLIGKIYKIS